NAELLSGDPPDDISRTYGSLDAFSDAHQGIIAPAIAETAVDDPQIPDMDQKDRTDGVLLRRALAIRIGVHEGREGRFVQAVGEAVALREALCLPPQRGDPSGRCPAQKRQRRADQE